MTLTVTALVLLAALMHATWNALVKASRDVTLDTALVAGSAALACALLLPFLPLPATASWPWLLTSGVVHQAYFGILSRAYRHGDLSYAYPLMRGLPPLMVAAGGALVLNDPGSVFLWSGIGMISLGVLCIGGFRRLLLQTRARATSFALANAVVIAGYTLVDGVGVRQSGNAASYGLWLFFLTGLPFMAVTLWQRRNLAHPYLQLKWRRAAVGGCLSVGSYLIALWAMTQAPIAAVAALRETSVIFAAIIGAVILKEPLGRSRIAGACIVVIGIALLRI
jgi:drug/metabolite transporter (DMT)-like permease